MDQTNKFLVGTILLDVAFLALLQVLQPPGDPRVYSVLAIVVVSPILAYLIVYRWDPAVRSDDRQSRRSE